MNNHSESIQSLREIYNKYFSLGHINTDINTKFAVISLLSYLTQLLKKKKSNITHYDVLKQIVKDKLPDSFCKSLSVICEDFSYGCKEFPTFGIEDKQIPIKIKEILSDWTPF